MRHYKLNLRNKDFLYINEAISSLFYNIMYEARYQSIGNVSMNNDDFKIVCSYKDKIYIHMHRDFYFTKYNKYSYNGSEVILDRDNNISYVLLNNRKIASFSLVGKDNFDFKQRIKFVKELI